MEAACITIFKKHVAKFLYFTFLTLDDSSTIKTWPFTRQNKLYLIWE